MLHLLQSIFSFILSIGQLGEDEKIRMQCQAREDYERCLLSEYNAGKREGIERGIEIEKMNTEKERRRAETEAKRAEAQAKKAEAAIRRAEELEKELLRLRGNVADEGT